MTFKVLCNSIKKFCLTHTFQDASIELEEIIFSIQKEELIQLVKEIGIIPEYIPHDSREEKIYTKVSDIINS